VVSCPRLAFNALWPLKKSWINLLASHGPASNAGSCEGSSDLRGPVQCWGAYHLSQTRTLGTSCDVSQCITEIHGLQTFLLVCHFIRPTGELAIYENPPLTLLEIDRSAILDRCLCQSLESSTPRSGSTHQFPSARSQIKFLKTCQCILVVYVLPLLVGRRWSPIANHIRCLISQS
jgi:hypothetical protein